VSKLVTELLQLQIENQKSQKKMLHDAEEMNKQYSKKEIMQITKALTGLAKNINLPEVQKGFVNNIVDIKEAKEKVGE
jgi:HPt (histidine-containing phosphotransfer) domain-containing protein